MRVPGFRTVVAFLLLIVAVSCKSEPKTKADPAGPAGDVREVTGEVTATLEGETRALAVGDVIAAGDRVTTGADGDVVIELRHNHVRWLLGPNQSRTPLEAAAWHAPPPVEGEVSGDRNAVAGRHAEREAAETSAGAADTMATGGGGSGSASSTTTGSGTGAASGDEDPVAADDPPRRGTGKAKGSGGSRKPDDPQKPPRDKSPDIGGGGGNAGCDEVSCLLAETPMPCCSKFKKGNDRQPACCADGETPSDLPEMLGKDEIVAGMASVKAKLAACGEQVTDPPNSVKLKFKVSASGSVTDVSFVEDIDPGLKSCLGAVAKKAKFAKTQNGGSFTYPAILR